MNAAAGGQWRPPPMTDAARRVALAAMLLGTFLSSIEATVVATAMQSIVDDLGGREIFSWAFSAYVLGVTVTVPLYGKAADLFGRRRTYVLGVGVFVAASALCGAAPSMGWLIVARAAQGLGAGAILPLTMTITGDLFPVQQRARLQGLFAAVWGVSSVAGPLAGAFLVQLASWRWIFYLNVPFSLLSVALLLATLREPPAAARGPVRVDWQGALLLFLGTGALLVALLPPQNRLGLGPALPWAGAAAALLVLFAWLERRVPEPVTPFDLLRDPLQAAANGAGFLLGVVLFAQISFMPVWVERVLGLDPVYSGQALVPVSLGWTTASFAGGRLLIRFGFRPVVRLGALAVVAGSAGVAARMSLGTAWLFMPSLLLFGLGMGAVITSFTVGVQERVGHERRGAATAMTVFSRSMGGAVGTSALGAWLAFATAGRPAGALGPALATLFWGATGAAAAAAVLLWVLFPEARVAPVEGVRHTGEITKESP